MSVNKNVQLPDNFSKEDFQELVEELTDSYYLNLDKAGKKIKLGLVSYTSLLEYVQKSNAYSDLALYLIASFLCIDFPKEGLLELIEDARDIYEFYIVRENFNPDPVPKNEEITIRFDDQKEVVMENMELDISQTIEIPSWFVRKIEKANEIREEYETTLKKLNSMEELNETSEDKSKVASKVHLLLEDLAYRYGIIGEFVAKEIKK